MYLSYLELPLIATFYSLMVLRQADGKVGSRRHGVWHVASKHVTAKHGTGKGRGDREGGVVWLRMFAHTDSL
ncbi:hypothetical protein BDP55DRAFT_667285 [Colletotrichum godetiae]|uniref:Uncharacterized protein n=1 Tax=Colletotrichum godetiae TaxID=1209918 RepID=A0AAJ0AI55_9PEZI|nr:uncharacterized protein BDP55DRAFT_667285 [Colletotrichum godetiae]KAK1674325.1 hypothetical protein BDP55DRAFT_667285 [Colletotrichum godetiae]